MNLLYDISALAVWHGSNFGKRGIYRVVEETFEALLKKSDFEVCATEDPAGGRAYLAARQASQGILGFRGPIETSNSSQLADGGIKIQQNLLNSLGQGRTLPHRLVRRSIVELNEFIDLPARKRNLQTFNLDHVNVFHQPGRFAIPEFIKNQRRKNFVRISTIYDFIPLHRNVIESNTLVARQFSKILKTISKDDAVICISEHVKEEACERLGLPRENIFVSHLAACKTMFYPCSDREKLQRIRGLLRLKESPYFLALCALDDRKNISVLLKAFSIVSKQQTDFDAKLVLAGSVSDVTKKTLMAMAKDLGISDHLVISGFVADEDLASLYSGATSFLFPSLAEGFGLPPLEAMQCGLPVISSNQTSLPEVVGNSGILLDPMAADDWAEAIYKLFTSDCERQRLRHSGLARSKEFSWEKSADDHLRIYKTMLKRHSST